MTTLLVQFKDRAFSIDLDAVQESPQGKGIVLRASRYQSTLEDGQLTDILFDIDDAILNVDGEGEQVVQQAVGAGYALVLLTDLGHSVELSGEQFL